MSSRMARRGGGRRTAAERADIARARGRQLARARATETIRGRRAAQALGQALSALPTPAEATPVEYGLDVFTQADNAELYNALRSLGAEKVKLVVRWEDENGHRSTTTMYSKGGVRASYIVAGSISHGGNVFEFLLSELFYFKAGSGGSNVAKRILSVTVEYAAAWAVA